LLTCRWGNAVGGEGQKKTVHKFKWVMTLEKKGTQKKNVGKKKVCGRKR